jgi:hypothetical protein
LNWDPERPVRTISLDRRRLRQVVRIPVLYSNPVERLGDLNSSSVRVNLARMYQRNNGGMLVTPAERERAAAYLAETRENLVLLDAKPLACPTAIQARAGTLVRGRMPRAHYRRG